jgi:ribonuclease BN (tRNA processing enzyme)
LENREYPIYNSCMTIIPLGTNGFFSSYGRQTACYAVPLGKILILLDAGTGLFRLAEPEGQRLLNKAETVHIFLSHYHLDHAFGFYAAFKLLEGKSVKVFAPSGRQIFSELVVLRHFPVDYEKVHRNFAWHNINEPNSSIDGYNVKVRTQNHRGERSFAFRFRIKDKEIAYVTDGEPTKNGMEFVENVDLLLHEHDYSGEELCIKDYTKQLIDGHVTTMGAAQIAECAKVRKLALIHHKPFYGNKRLEKLLKIAKNIFPRTILAKDLETIIV